MAAVWRSTVWKRASAHKFTLAKLWCSVSQERVHCSITSLWRLREARPESVASSSCDATVRLPPNDAAALRARLCPPPSPLPRPSVALPLPLPSVVLPLPLPSVVPPTLSPRVAPSPRLNPLTTLASPAAALVRGNFLPGVRRRPAREGECAIKLCVVGRSVSIARSCSVAVSGPGLLTVRWRQWS